MVSLLVRLWVEMHGVHSQKRRLTVSLLVRLWVEIHTKSYMEALQFVSLLVRLWVEISVSPKHHFHSMSASLWGCELKCKKVGIKMAEISQPPCEAVSWNVGIPCKYLGTLRQPPCEAVSWNINVSETLDETKRQPPCEAVSWNNFFGCSHTVYNRQPPCEAVSWNTLPFKMKERGEPSASLWGCELKWVRSLAHRDQPVSASLWGCELK